MRSRLKSSIHQQVLKTDGFQLAQDKLKSSALDPTFFGHAGFPEDTDSLAYEPVQRLLAVSTSDGRIKIIGHEGVEKTTKAADHTGTRHIQFLVNKGAVLRVTETGDIQLFSMADGALLESVPCGDQVTAVAVMHGTPYLLLGCESGDVMVATLLDRAGAPAQGAEQAATLQLQPYEGCAAVLEDGSSNAPMVAAVTAEIMGGKGPVLSLAAHMMVDQPRMLIVHEQTGALVWDVRYQAVVVRAYNGDPLETEDGQEAPAAEPGSPEAAGKATTACWIGRHGNCFATGHEAGDVFVWGLPKSCQTAIPPLEAGDAVLLDKLRVAPLDEVAAPVRSVTYVPGSEAGRKHTLLVFGGQAAEMPDVLTLVPMHSLNQDARQGATTEEAAGEPHSIPWFGNVRGFALVPPDGSISERDNPAAVMVLTEGGQLMVHDLKTFQPVPLSLPFQELQVASASKFCCSSAELPAGAGVLHCVTLDRLRAVQSHSPGSAAKSGTAGKWRFVLGGGQPPCTGLGVPGACDLYFTGHRDGRVRAWDMTSNVPALVATVPHDSGGPGGKLRGVASLQTDTLAGLLVVSHEQGEVRIYQFSTSPQEVDCMELDGRHKPSELKRQQPPGFQCILQCTQHSAAVGAIAIASRVRLVALGDAEGWLSMVDLAQPAVLYNIKLADQAISSLHFAPHTIGPPRASPSKPGKASHADRRLTVDAPNDSKVALYVALADSSVGLVDAEEGSSLSNAQWVRPKNACTALALALLDVQGQPVGPYSAHLQLHWASNSAAVAAADSGSESSAPKASVGPAQGGSVLSDGTYLGSAASRQDAGVMLDDPVLSGATAASGATLSSAGVHEEEEPEAADSEDDDDLLAAAAAAMEAQEMKSKGKKHLGILEKKGRKDKEKEQPPAVGLVASPAKSTGGLSSKRSGIASAASPVKSETSEGGHRGFFGRASIPASPTGSVGSAFSSQAPGSARLLASPLTEHMVATASLDTTPVAPVAHVLLCADNTLRLYPADGLKQGDRSTVKKARLQEAVGFAAVFDSQHGAGVVAVSRSGGLQVVALPSLEPLQQFSLAACLGFAWSWQEDAFPSTSLHSLCALAPDGQLAMIGPCNEVARLSLVRGVPQPAEPASLYDFELAQAAVATARAVAQFEEREREQPARERHLTQDLRRDPPRSQGSGIGGFLHKVTDVANKVIDESGRELHTIGKHLHQDFDRIGKSLVGHHAGSAPKRPPPPPLSQLFSNTAQEPAALMLEPDETPSTGPSLSAPQRSGVGGHTGPPSRRQTSEQLSRRPTTDAFSSGAASSTPMAGGRQTPRNQGAEAGPSPDSLELDADRAELFRGASAARSAAKGNSVAPRSAADIKAAYGRNNSKAKGAQAVMSENIARMEERGEKLRNLQDKTEDLGDDAMDFASMAKQLAAQQANRKWWQM